MKFTLYRHRKRCVWVAAGLATCAIAVPGANARPALVGPPSAQPGPALSGTSDLSNQTAAIQTEQNDTTATDTVAHGRGSIFARRGRASFETPTSVQTTAPSSDSSGTDWTAAGAGAGAGLALGVGLIGVAALMSRRRRTFAGV